MSIERCQMIDLPKIHDPRGNLTFVESNKQIPFAIERAFGKSTTPQTIWIGRKPGGLYCLT